MFHFALRISRKKCSNLKQNPKSATRNQLKPRLNSNKPTTLKNSFLHQRDRHAFHPRFIRVESVGWHQHRSLNLASHLPRRNCRQHKSVRRRRSFWWRGLAHQVGRWKPQQHEQGGKPRWNFAEGLDGRVLFERHPFGQLETRRLPKSQPALPRRYWLLQIIFFCNYCFFCWDEFNKIQGVTCPDIPNASYDFTRSYLNGKFVRGTQITYECADGYISTLDDNSVECTSNGWSENAGCVKGAWYIFKVRLKKLLSVK